MGRLTLDAAVTIAQRTLAAARSTGCAPLAVAVLDDGGHLVALLREDGAAFLRPTIAVAKAWGALGLGMSSRGLQAKSERFLSALSAMSGGRVVPVPGGVLVRGEKGVLLGAVGVSGDASDKDEACAVAGIRAAGLTPDA